MLPLTTHPQGIIIFVSDHIKNGGHYAVELNKASFYNITYNNTLLEHERYNIGTYKEKKLHIILKNYFCSDSSYFEVPVNGYVADIKCGSCITEIETNGFSGLKPKLAAYLPEYRVNLVLPLAAKKYVSWIDTETSEISVHRPSPKKESAYDVLFEMVRILPHVSDPNLCVIGVMLEIEEYRMLDGWSRNKKRGSHRFERIPSDLLDIVEFRTNDDFRRYVPDICRDEFSVRDFAAAAKIDCRKASGIVKVLEARGIISSRGKKGRANIYIEI